MDRHQRHEEVLEAIECVRRELAVCGEEGFSLDSDRVLERLTTLYNCLDVAGIRTLLAEHRGMDQRQNNRLRFKKAA